MAQQGTSQLSRVEQHTKHSPTQYSRVQQDLAQRVQRSSERCNLADQSATQLTWVQHTVTQEVQHRSVGWSVAQDIGYRIAQKGAAKLRRIQCSSAECSVAQKDSVQLSRMQYSSDGFSVAQQDAVQLRWIQCSSAGCSVAQEGAAWLRWAQRSSAGNSVAQEGAAQSGSRVRRSQMGCSVAQLQKAWLRGILEPNGLADKCCGSWNLMGRRICAVNSNRMLIIIRDIFYGLFCTRIVTNTGETTFNIKGMQEEMGGRGYLKTQRKT